MHIYLIFLFTSTEAFNIFHAWDILTFSIREPTHWFMSAISKSHKVYKLQCSLDLSRAKGIYLLSYYQQRNPPLGLTYPSFAKPVRVARRWCLCGNHLRTYYDIDIARHLLARNKPTIYLTQPFYNIIHIHHQYNQDIHWSFTGSPSVSECDIFSKEKTHIDWFDCWGRGISPKMKKTNGNGLRKIVNICNFEEDEEKINIFNRRDLILCFF